MPTPLSAAELVPIDTPAHQAAYAAALAESGRSYTKMSAPYEPKPDWPYNSGGTGNQEDDPLRHYLARRWYGDENALQSGFNILSYLAENMTGVEHTYQNGHGQRHPNFGLYALLARERGDAELSKRLIEAEIKLYALNLGSKEWSSTGPTTFRPGCRFLSTTARLIHDVSLLTDAGLIHPNQFPGNEPLALCVRITAWAKKWFWEMQSGDRKNGWVVSPGLYRHDPDERDWLYWAQGSSDSEETHLTAFMHYALFPRDVAIALTWLDGLIDEDTRRLWTKRLRDMSTWALAVAYDPATGLAKRAQDWSPEILEARGPFRLYASPETGEKTHSIAATIAASKAPKERRKKELVNALKKGMKLPPGEVDEGLAIAALELGFGGSAS